MLRTILVTSIRTRGILRAWLPSNILLDVIRTRAGLKWGMPAMLIGGLYFAIAYWCTITIDNDGPGWLHLVFLVCVWSGFRFIIMGPVSLITLIAVRARERTHGGRDNSY
ncbi:sulfate permease [Brevibacterium sp. XM4083]|uniref:sulfate permease n=1 Tax=Brevibacterium sp. XM4083 TaxID=2583238 RepID=UPI00112881D2|nr:sulfate permease [Brevibacterium sp. XM4083]MCM1011769.1 sulfate permease [Brevibacterium sp. XM4083]